jgi:UrcA family protein
MTKTIPAAVALATVLTFAGAANAETSHIVVLKQTLTYSRDELATPQGAQGLLASVDGVALRLCRQRTYAAFERPVASQIATCRTNALARAVAELDAPLVTAAYADRRSALLATS